MEKLIFFLKIIAWFGAIIGTVGTAICIISAIYYTGSREELIDKINGVKRSFPITKWFIAAVISWSFIIVF